MPYPIALKNPMEGTVRYYDCQGNRIDETTYLYLYAEADKLLNLNKQ